MRKPLSLPITRPLSEEQTNVSVFNIGRISEYALVLYNNSAISFIKGGTIVGLQVLTMFKKVFSDF
jgi:outer membrane lipopolysaccharide assembly protein LptE/RlpB